MPDGLADAGRSVDEHQVWVVAYRCLTGAVKIGDSWVCLPRYEGIPPMAPEGDFRFVRHFREVGFDKDIGIWR
jgi:hypothetical protein